MDKKLTPAELIRPNPPGISWTAPPKSRPWLNPPKYVDLQDVAQGYIDNLSSPEMIDSMIGAIETGAPLSSLAEITMLTGVYGGRHTLDMGILVMPIIIEMYITAAELHGADYIVYSEEAEPTPISERVIREALKEASTKKQTPVVVEEPTVNLSGLMSRKEA